MRRSATSPSSDGPASASIRIDDARRENAFGLMISLTGPARAARAGK